MLEMINSIVVKISNSCFHGNLWFLNIVNNNGEAPIVILLVLFHVVCSVH